MTEKLKLTLSWLLDRLAENSTWRGIILAVTAAGIVINEDQAGHITAAGLAVIALINLFRKAPPSGKEVAEAIKSGDTSELAKPTTDPKP